MGNRIYLRTLNVSDASKEYCNWINDPYIHNYLETKKTTVRELRGYIKQKKMSDNCLFYGIFLSENDEHVGNVKLEPIDFENKTATLGILIGNIKYWGKGYCKEAITVLTDYAFNQLNVDFIDLGVYTDNIAAIKCYEKAGFSEVGRTDNNGVIMRVHKKESCLR